MTGVERGFRGFLATDEDSRAWSAMVGRGRSNE